MEALLVIVGLFVLVAFPIAVLSFLSGINHSLDHLADRVQSLSFDVASLKRHAESAKSAELSSSPPSERGVARSAGGSTPCGAVPEPAAARPRTEYSPGLASLGSPLSEGAESKSPPPLPPVAAGAVARAEARVPSPAKSQVSVAAGATGRADARPSTPAILPLPAADEPPPEPTKFEQWAAAAWDWLRVGEAWRPGWIPGEYAVAAVQLLRAAALLLLFGAAWFVRYVHEQGWFSPAGRVAAGFAAAAGEHPPPNHLGVVADQCVAGGEKFGDRRKRQDQRRAVRPAQPPRVIFP